MNGYIGIWKGTQFEVYAGSSYEAQKLLVPMVQKTTRKKVNGYDITVMLCEKDGEQVTHKPLF